MNLQSTPPETMPAAASTVQRESEMDRPRLRNRALRPAPRNSGKDPDMGINQAPPYYAYPAMSQFSSFSFPSTVDDNDPDYRLDHNGVSPHSEMSNNRSSPLRWQTGDTAKRAKHLERNRAAASKSRQKKKRETDLLRTRFEEASRRKSGLEDEIKDLHGQLLSLKDQILLHSRCDDEAIHTYLGQMVKHASKNDSVSSASSTSAPSVTSASTVSTSSEVSNGPDADNHHSRRSSGAISPLSYMHSHGHSNVPDMALSKVPVQRGGTGFACGAEKPMGDDMFQGESYFDLQISIN